MTFKSRRPLLLFIALAACLTVAGCSGPEATPGPWPQWRGPDGTGVSQETGLPSAWSAEEGVRWSVDLPGEGISSPIIGHEVVYVTAGEAEEFRRGVETSLVLLALDLDTGAKLWKTQVAKRPREQMAHRHNRSAAATPATDGETIYAYFGTHLGAVSKQGKLLWSKEVDGDYLDSSHYGTGSSLVLTDDAVIVFRDREKDEEGLLGWLAAFRKDTGEELWREQWDNSCCSYTTPLAIDFAEESELLVAHARRVVSYRPETGKRLWERDLEMWQPVASPVIEGNLLCAASGAHGVREMGCWRLRNKNGKRGIKPLWKSKKAVPSMSSPILFDGLLYTMHERGFVRCYSAKSGKELWRKRLPAGSYVASLVAGDGKIYAVSLDGTTSVFTAGRKFELLSYSPVPEGGVLSSPAIGDGSLVIRSQTQLHRIDGTAPEA